MEVLKEYDDTRYEAEQRVTFYEAKKRYVDKIKDFGELQLDGSRDWVVEALEEVYDAINYLVFLSIKLRRLKAVGDGKKV